MCSEKQLEFVKKLKKWKNAEHLDLNVIRQMPDKEVSALIDDLKARPSVHQQVGRRESFVAPKPAAGVWNPIQAGMVKKFVADKHEAKWVAEYPDKFADLCLDVYVAFNAADALIKERFPEVQR